LPLLRFRDARATLVFAMMPEGYSHRQAEADFGIFEKSFGGA
jgi:hypothetical protein